MRFRVYLSLLLLAVGLRAQPAPMQADPTTGVLSRPTPAKFASANGIQTTVANVAALKALTVANYATGSVVSVRGYTSNGDGGGGEFYYDSSSSATTNLGTCFAPNSGSGRWLRVYSGSINVKWCGAKGDDNIQGALGTDDTAAIQAAINLAAVRGGVVFFPSGHYLTTAQLTLSANVELRGEGGKGDSQNAAAYGNTVIHGKHTGDSVVNFVGLNGCKLTNISIYGDSNTVPDCGVLCGRAADLGSAGHHTFHDVVVGGYFAAAAVVSVASENNTWESSVISLVGGGAKIAFFTGQSPNLPYGSVTTVSAYGGTNLNHTYRALSVVNYVNDSTAVGFYDDVGSVSGSHTFFGCWSAMMNGAHVYIRVGTVNDTNCPGVIAFFGWNGESLNAGTPTAGFHIDNGGNAWSLSGLYIQGCRIDLPVAAKFIEGNATLVLKDSLIDVPTTSALPSITTTGWTNVSINMGQGSGYTRRRFGAEIVDGAFTTTGALTATGNLAVNGSGPHTLAGKAAVTINAGGNGFAATFQNSGGNSGIELLASGNKSAYLVGDTAGDAYLYTNGTAGAAGTQVVRFHSTGAITTAGALTTTGNLTVNGSGPHAFSGKANVTINAGGNGFAATFQNSGGNSGIELVASGNKAAYLVGDTAGDAYLYTNGTSGTAGTLAARFDSSGNFTGYRSLTLNSATAGYIEGTEQGSSPAAPATDGFRLYAKDNGAGKTVLYVRFATGAEQQIAIQP